jgi:hypothetical protein
LTKDVTLRVLVAPGCVYVLILAIDVSVIRVVDPAWVAVAVLTKLVTSVLIVIVVVLVAARGMTAPRRTMRAGSVGMQDSVMVVFFVTVLSDTLLTVTELLALMVVVFVLLGSNDMIVLIVVEAPLGVMTLVTVAVIPSLWVIVVGLRLTVRTERTVVVPLIVDVGAFAVVVPPIVVVALTALFLVTESGVTVRPVSSVITSVDVEVMSGEVYETVAVSFSISVLTTSAPVSDAVDEILITVVEVASGAMMVVLAVSLTIAVVVV